MGKLGRKGKKAMAEIIQADKVINAEEGDLRIWWIRNPPNPAQFILIDSPDKAVRLLDQLGARDIKNGVQVNVGGLEVFENGGWTEWYDEDGNDIDNRF